MVSIGINPQEQYSKALLENIGHIKANKFVLENVVKLKGLGKPLLLHGRFPMEGMEVTGNNFCHPGFFDWFKIDEFRKMVEVAQPSHLSFHIGLAAERVTAGWLEGQVDKALSPPLPEKEVFRRIKAGVQRLKAAFPDKLFLLENMPYQPKALSGAFEHICEPEFINRMLEETDSKFLLDVAHAQCTASVLEIDLKDYLKRLPLHKAIELHLSKTEKKEWGLFDCHAPLDREDLRLLQELLPLCPHLKFMTLEIYDAPEKMLEQVELVKEVIRK